ncbi:hypothetical protein [Flavobacterium sp. '19STA2R22 D10 B1']|uniref:hypothetical protein n=1 Tax=Flavobacterium aerium TaxID=3037261 RepID=UPI00278BC7D8|nr:hypothetical protein [Flavobacterium sp. '19STA2R22 D10 B1']
MKLGLATYQCADCLHTFDAPLFREAYGEFLLWSKQGNVAYLNAIEDVVYKEVEDLLWTHPKTLGMSSLNCSNLLQKIYGSLTCDRDQVGNSFEIGTHPPCPLCKSQNMDAWDFKTPSEVIEVEVKPITYTNWVTLTEQEKFRLLDVKIGTL